MATNIFFFSSSLPFLKHSPNFLSLTPKPFTTTTTKTHSSLSNPNTTPPPLDTFWDWLTKQGAVSPKSPVKPGVVKEGIGLVAQRDISRNEVVLEVPKKLWVNVDLVASSEIGSFCSGLKPWISVALFLLREKIVKKDGSFWKSYLDILPNSTDSTIFWSEEELLEIQGTQLLNTTMGVKDYLRREFEKLKEEVLIPHKALFPVPITLDDFSWAFGILRSRAFSQLRGQNLVLIPATDLINHSPDIKTEEYAYKIKGAGLFSRDLLFSLRSPIPVKAGEQVLIQYDINKSNAELALDYGFVETNQSRNAYTLTLQISESDSFYGDKLDIAETNGLGETADFSVVLGEPLPPTLLPYLRLVALGGTDAFLLESIFRNSIWGHLELPVSQPNEELICRVVREACKSALSGYHTTIDEDKELKEKLEDLTPRSAIAVEVRMGEKVVLQQIDDIFAERESELNELEYYQERRLKDLGLIGEQGEIIFWESK